VVREIPRPASAVRDFPRLASPAFMRQWSFREWREHPARRLRHHLLLRKKEGPVHTMRAHHVLSGIGHILERGAVVVIGLVMMPVGMGLGITMIMLPVGLTMGLLGVAMVVGGLFAHFDDV